MFHTYAAEYLLFVCNAQMNFIQTHQNIIVRSLPHEFQLSFTAAIYVVCTNKMPHIITNQKNIYIYINVLIHYHIT